MNIQADDKLIKKTIEAFKTLLETITLIQYQLDSEPKTKAVKFNQKSMKDAFKCLSAIDSRLGVFFCPFQESDFYPYEMKVGDGYHMVSPDTIHEHVMLNNWHKYLNECFYIDQLQGKYFAIEFDTITSKYIIGREVNESEVYYV